MAIFQSPKQVQRAAQFCLISVGHAATTATTAATSTATTKTTKNTTTTHELIMQSLHPIELYMTENAHAEEMHGNGCHRSNIQLMKCVAHRHTLMQARACARVHIIGNVRSHPKRVALIVSLHSEGLSVSAIKPLWPRLCNE